MREIFTVCVWGGVLDFDVLEGKLRVSFPLFAMVSHGWAHIPQTPHERIIERSVSQTPCKGHVAVVPSHICVWNGVFYFLHGCSSQDVCVLT